MSTELHRPTAKIYTFPSGGRAPPPRYQTASKPSSRTTSARAVHDEQIVRAEYGSGWYHEAAVEEAEECWER